MKKRVEGTEIWFRGRMLRIPMRKYPGNKDILRKIETRKNLYLQPE